MRERRLLSQTADRSGGGSALILIICVHVEHYSCEPPSQRPPSPQGYGGAVNGLVEDPFAASLPSPYPSPLHSRG